ncbi:unnamed protein product [Onchocerca flexuosa]|uniref:RNA polymerase sigma factor RpoD n=1 Tax=Onchocerca flexuosa TaxID=387005 RepID=A0A183HXE3_9BILA|nr:unnamed protein product [Onchocerca flexuosa]
MSRETEVEADDEETEEEFLIGDNDNDNELKDVLRDIAKLNENDIMEV